MSDDAKVPREELLLKLLNMTTSDNDNIALMSARKANKLLADAGWSWEKLLAAKIKIVENPFKNGFTPVRSNRKEFVAPPLKPTGSAGPGMIWEWDGHRGQWMPVAAPQPAPPPPARRPPMPAYSPGAGMQWSWDNLTQQWMAITVRAWSSPTPPPPGTSTRASSFRPAGGFGMAGAQGHGLTRSNKYAGPCWCCGDDVDINAGSLFNPLKEFNRGPDKWKIMCEPCNVKGAAIGSSAAGRTYQPAGLVGATPLGKL